MKSPGHSPESVSQAAQSGPGGSPIGLHPQRLDPRDLPVGFLCLAWVVLVGIGILGRLWQPVYGVSPLIGIGLCAGALFANRFAAASVPAVALAASNFALPGGGSYGSWTMAAIIYAAFTWPIFMGGLVPDHRLRPHRRGFDRVLSCRAPLLPLDSGGRHRLVAGPFGGFGGGAGLGPSVPVGRDCVSPDRRKVASQAESRGVLDWRGNGRRITGGVRWGSQVLLLRNHRFDCSYRCGNGGIGRRARLRAWW